VLYDAMVVPGGREAVNALGNIGHALEFIKDQYRHCKPILAIGAGASLLENAGASAMLESGEEDPGVLVADEGKAREALPRFVEALARHRHFAREMDPPLVWLAKAGSNCLNARVDQVVHNYGDVCQAVTGLALEQEAPILIDEFRILNRRLDDAIAAPSRLSCECAISPTLMDHAAAAQKRCGGAATLAWCGLLKNRGMEG
jgi:hypothetical protein